MRAESPVWDIQQRACCVGMGGLAWFILFRFICGEHVEMKKPAHVSVGFWHPWARII